MPGAYAEGHGALTDRLVEEAGVLVADLDVTKAHTSRRRVDPVGHYNRPDVLQLRVGTRAKRAGDFGED